MMMAGMALHHVLALIAYLVVFSSKLQMEIATALAFKLPKPTDLLNKFNSNVPVLQDWSLDEQNRLTGTVTGHPVVPDGEIVTTAILNEGDVDVAIELQKNDLSKKNRNRLVPKEQSLKYTKLVSTFSGTKYFLLPLNIQVDAIPFVATSRIGSNLSYKQQLAYLEEQIETVRVLSEKEDDILERRKSKQTILKGGGILTAIVLGVCYFVGDFDDLVKTSFEKTYFTEFDSNESKLFGKPERVALPYLEDQIKSTEKLFMEVEDIDSNSEGKRKSSIKRNAEDETSRGGKGMQEVRESSDSEAIDRDASKVATNEIQLSSGDGDVASEDNRMSVRKVSKTASTVTTSASASTIAIDAGKDPKTVELLLQGEQQQQQKVIASDRYEKQNNNYEKGASPEITEKQLIDALPLTETNGNEENSIVSLPKKSDDLLPKKITQEMAESDGSSQSQEEIKENDDVLAFAAKIYEEATKTPDQQNFSGEDTIKMQPQQKIKEWNEVDDNASVISDIKSQQKILKKIDKSVSNLNNIREGTETEFEKVLSDLAWAGKTILDDNSITLEELSIDSNQRYLDLTSSAITLFGEDGVSLLYKYAIDAMKDVCDVFSLENKNYSSQLTDILKDYSTEKKVQLATTASVVAVAGVIALAAVRSKYRRDQGQDSDERFVSGNTNVESSRSDFEQYLNINSSWSGSDDFNTDIDFVGMPTTSNEDVDMFTSYQVGDEQTHLEVSTTNYPAESYTNNFDRSRNPFVSRTQSIPSNIASLTESSSDESSLPADDSYYPNQIEREKVEDALDPGTKQYDFKSNIDECMIATTSSTSPGYAMKPELSDYSQLSEVEQFGIEGDIINESNINDYSSNAEFFPYNESNGENVEYFQPNDGNFESLDSNGNAIYEEQQREQDQEIPTVKLSSSIKESNGNGVPEKLFPPVGMPLEEGKVNQDDQSKSKQSFPSSRVAPKSILQMEQRNSAAFVLSSANVFKPKQTFSSFERDSKSTSFLELSGALGGSTRSAFAEKDIVKRSNSSVPNFNSSKTSRTEDKYQRSTKHYFSPFRDMSYDQQQQEQQAVATEDEYESKFKHDQEQQEAEAAVAAAAAEKAAAAVLAQEQEQQAAAAISLQQQQEVETEAAALQQQQQQEAEAAAAAVAEKEAAAAQEQEQQVEAAAAAEKAAQEAALFAKEQQEKEEAAAAALQLQQQQEAVAVAAAAVAQQQREKEEEEAVALQKEKEAREATVAALEKEQKQREEAALLHKERKAAEAEAAEKEAAALLTQEQQAAAAVVQLQQQQEAEAAAAGKEAHEAALFAKEQQEKEEAVVALQLQQQQQEAVVAAERVAAAAAVEQEQREQEKEKAALQKEKEAREATAAALEKEQKQREEAALLHKERKSAAEALEQEREDAAVAVQKEQEEVAVMAAAALENERKEREQAALEKEQAEAERLEFVSRKSALTSFNTSESRSNFKPKIPSKPQLDMYERMRTEQVKREEFQQLRHEENIQPNNIEKKEKERKRLIKNTKSHKTKDIDMELKTEYTKEKDRMEEIHNLAREQAKFEVETRGRGFTKEQKAKKERSRMDRLQELAKEQAKFEFDRNEAQDQNGSNDLHDMNSDGQLDDKPKNNPIIQIDTPKKEEIIPDQAQTKQKVSKIKDVLKGKKGESQEQASIFQSANSMSKEEALRGKKTRMENLEKIANNQDLYETNKKFGLKKDERIIDVEGYKLDNSTEKIVDEGVNEVRQKQYQKKQQRNQKEIEGKKREGKGEKSQVLSQQQPLKEKELFDDEKMDTRIKKKQLESQARKRSKQQYQQNGRIGTETNNNATRKRVTLQPTPKVKEEEKEIIQQHQRNERVDTEINNSATKEDLSLKYVGQTVLNEQDQVVANAIMKADGSSYKPTTEAMGNTSIMLRQVFGTGLSNYKGKKEFLHKKNKVRVHAGRPLHIPIRVSIPGSVIELSIEKISSDFHFGILAVPDKGMPVNVKVRNLYLFLLLEF